MRSAWGLRTTAAVLGIVGLLLPAADAGAASSGPSVVLVGHGWGHGRGLSQWGAYGYAVDQGWTSRQILDHYYGGTTPGTIGTPAISVRLSSLDGNQESWITSSKPFSVGGIRIEAGSAAKIVRTANGWSLYASYGGCSHPNNYGPYAPTSSDVVMESPAVEDTIVVCANNRGYQGSLKQAVVSGTSTTWVNTLPMEQYLRGVVPRESSASWADSRAGLGMAALEAQAVAARSYAWSENRYPYAKTCDTTSCQVYGGLTLNGTSIADPRSDAAVANTVGMVRLTSSGGVARTEFSSSTGGWTAGGVFPQVEDRGDSRSPNHTWTVRLDGARLASTYGVGTFRQLLVVAQDGKGVAGGRVSKVRVVGSVGSKDIPATSFQATWGLRSDWFFPVDQPARQVTSLNFVKLAYSDRVYRHFGLSSNGWQAHAYVTADDYTLAGRPSVTTLGSAYVRYPWSTTVYAVTYWPNDEYWQWDMLSAGDLAKAGNPRLQIAGFVYGTVFYKTSSADPAVYAYAPDNSVHHLTYAEWRAAGYPKPRIWSTGPTS